jgi:serine protease Do
LPFHQAGVSGSFFFVGADDARSQVEGDFLGLQRRIVQIYSENEGAVVRVRARFQGSGEEDRPQVILGTGFFISREGHVLTNANATHLSEAEPADRISVEHRRVEYAAEMLGTDWSTNLTLLRVDTLPTEFRFLHLTDSPDTPPIGSMVVGISSPFEFNPSPILALVTGIESRFGNRLFRVPYIRTSMRLGPAEGGAPLLDLNGKLIGVMVASLPEVDQSYSIPSRAALRIRDDLLFSGKVTFGWLGFEAYSKSTAHGGSHIAIREVIPGTPAEKAGLVGEDVLVRIGDQAIDEITDVGNALFYLREGQFVTVVSRRDEEELTFTFRVAARPDEESDGFNRDPDEG